MTVKQIITGIKDDIAEKLPSFIAACGLPPVDNYPVGYPFDQDKLSCCVRLSKLEFLGDLEFIIHLSLPRVTEEAAYDYLEAARNYLTDFDTTDYGYYAGTYILDMYENDFNHGDVQAYFLVTLKKAADDCGL
jgi:hypothetical protein